MYIGQATAEKKVLSKLMMRAEIEDIIPILWKHGARQNVGDYYLM